MQFHQCKCSACFVQKTHGFNFADFNQYDVFNKSMQIYMHNLNSITSSNV